MEAEPSKARNSRTKRKERAHQLNQEKQNLAGEGLSGDEGEEGSSPRCSKDRIRSKHRRQRNNSTYSCDEDIIDGFAIVSFRTVEDLENGGKNKGSNARPRKCDSRRSSPSTDGDRSKEKEARNKSKKGIKKHASKSPSPGGSPRSLLLLEERTKNQDSASHRINTGHCSLPRCGSRDRFSDASTHSSSGQGYVCDIESGDEKNLCAWLSPHMPPERTLPLDKKLLATIWLLANQESYRGVADRFGINKGTLHKVIMTTCHRMTELRMDVIRWPDRRQMDINAEGFAQRCGFPGVVGAIDGTHIHIPGHSAFRDSFINKKGVPSMQLQVVSNHNLEFIHVTTGYPGSVHDARVFRNCEVKIFLEEGSLPGRYHLLGDSAYPLSAHMMVPFRDNGHLSALEKTFNSRHSSTRVEVERSIGLLKGKWRRLRFLDMTNVEEIPLVIFSVCILHNFVIQQQGVDADDIDSLEEQAENVCEEDGEQSGEDKRHDIAAMLVG